jgi:plastocyanin
MQRCATLTAAAATAALLAIGLLATASARAASATVDVRTPQGAPIADAVVWLEPAAASATKARRPGRAEIRQVKLEFVPFVSVLPVGTQVDFPNRDKVKHHVYSFSNAKSFEIQLYSGMPAEPVVFDKPGPVVLGCNIHDWMEAYVMVVNSAWYGKSDASGRIGLGAVAPGRYLLHAWHPYQQAAAATQAVEFTKGRDTAAWRIDIELAVPPRKPRRPLDEHY